MDIGHLLRAAAQDNGGRASRPAVTVADTTLTHGELLDAALRLVGGLDRAGVRPRDRVALVMSNSTDYWAAYLAITAAGAIAVRVNFRLGPDEARHALTDSGASLVLSDLEHAPKVRLALPTGAGLCIRQTGDADGAGPSWADLAGGPPADLPPPRSPDDPAMIMYTSGTTGTPKGALWTHANTMSFALMQAARWGFAPNTVSLVTGPMYHVGALEDLSVPTLLMGGHAVALASGGFSLDTVVSAADRHGVSDVLLFPFMIYDLLRRGADGALPSVRRLYTGGEPLKPWARALLRTALPGAELHQIYGLTEGTPIALAAGPDQTGRSPGSVGVPMPLCEVMLAGPDGREADPGTAAEIWVRSPAVCAGYWRRPDATRDTFADGWCRTGDLGRRDAHGNVEIVGRLKDMIRSGGENIYPAELEAVLAEHPAVADVAVVGAADDRWTEVVCAVVVLNPGTTLSLDELAAHSRQRLAAYKTPRRLVVVDELPRTASGKVQKYLLQAAAGGPADRHDRPEARA